MASSWGSSWLNNWGNSWGAQDGAVASIAGGRRRSLSTWDSKRTKHERLRADRDELERLERSKTFHDALEKTVRPPAAKTAEPVELRAPPKLAPVPKARANPVELEVANLRVDAARAATTAAEITAKGNLAQKRAEHAAAVQREANEVAERKRLKEQQEYDDALALVLLSL